MNIHAHTSSNLRPDAYSSQAILTPIPCTTAMLRANAGLTLLELMFAAAIMASTLVCILGSIVAISSTSDIAGDQAAVMARVSTIVEELRRASEPELLAYTPETAADGSPAQSVEVRYVINDEGQTVTAPYIPADLAASALELPNPLHVKITVAAVSRSGRPFTMQTAAMLRR